MKSELNVFQERLRGLIERRVTRCLWHKGDTPPFKPALLSRVYGDGRALFALYTMNLRPRYYVVQGDSGWKLETEIGDGENFGEFLAMILDDLEAQFGIARCSSTGNCLYNPKTERIRSCSCEDCSNGKLRARWPMVDAEGGCSWGRLDWPAGIFTAPLPNGYAGTMLAYPRTRLV